VDDDNIPALRKKLTAVEYQPGLEGLSPPLKGDFLFSSRAGSRFAPGDKKEAEIIIRNKYRELERTPVVNLAYSVLKNQSLRVDYLWILENDKLVETLRLLLSVKKVRGLPGKDRDLFTA